MSAYRCCLEIKTFSVLSHETVFWDRPGIQLDGLNVKTSLTESFQSATFSVAATHRSGDCLLRLVG